MSSMFILIATVMVTIVISPSVLSSNANIGCGQLNHRMQSNPEGTSFPLYYPWMVSIANVSRYSFCGGTLINDHQILTAAHCVSDKKATELRVIFGVTDLSEVRKSDILTPLEIHLHPDYKFEDNIHKNDLAIIEISNITFAPNVQPICIPENDHYKEIKNQKLTVLGWGQLSAKDHGIMAQKLQQLVLPIVSNDKCGQIWGTNIPSSEFICHGQPEHNICNGDAGGPLMLFDEEKNRWELVGIASAHGAICGDKYPGIYVKISSNVVDRIKMVSNYI